MAASEALWSGFASFFSIWQVCILQISPFFMAYIAGIYLVARRQVADPGAWQRMILPLPKGAAHFATSVFRREPVGLYTKNWVGTCV